MQAIEDKKSNSLIERHVPVLIDGMGWITGPVGGVPAVWHDGITGAFHADLIIEPQHSWGAILLFNSFTVLVQGVFEQIETGVARLLAAQEPGPAGLSLSAFYLLTEAILALISLGVVWSVLRLRYWFRRFVLHPRHRILHASWRLSGSWSSLSCFCLASPLSQA